MITYKTIELDESDLDALHDIFFMLFGFSPTDKEIEKLIGLCEDWDGETDTLGKEQFMDEIANYFVGMSVPSFGSTQEYKDTFWKKLEEVKPKVFEFIKGD